MFSNDGQNLDAIIIDDSNSSNQSLISALNNSNCSVATRIELNEKCLSFMSNLNTDVIIFNVKQVNSCVLTNVMSIHTLFKKPILILTLEKNCKSIEQSLRAGASIFYSDGQNFNNITFWLTSAMLSFKQNEKYQQQIAELKAELNRYKTVDKAKRILMSQNTIGEQEAYQLIRKSAMDNKQKIEVVAQKINEAAELMRMV